MKSNVLRKFLQFTIIPLRCPPPFLIAVSPLIRIRARVAAAIREHARKRDPNGNPNGIFDS